MACDMTSASTLASPGIWELPINRRGGHTPAIVEEDT